MFRTIEELTPGTTVLTRVDLNSPVIDDEVQDNPRFGRHAETISRLADDGKRVVAMSHQGRPGSDDFVSLDAHARILESYLDRSVAFCPEPFGKEATAAISSLESGDVLLLDNVRMADEEMLDRTPEEHAQSDFVRSLAPLADAYVGDAYSAAHRAHASIVGLPVAIDDVFAGPVMDAEYKSNTSIVSRTFDGDVVMVLGGTKADDLIRVIEGVSERVDAFLLGGVIGELCLRAEGYDVGFDIDGTDIFDDIWADQHEEIADLLGAHGDRFVLPEDLAFEGPEGDRQERPVAGIEKTESYLDIGSETAEQFAETVADASAVFVKGAVGVFEDERFCRGTVRVLEAIGQSDGFSVVGGGDTSRAIDLYDLDPANYDHVSIAGGAYVRALAGEPLPGVEVLRK